MSDKPADIIKKLREDWETAKRDAHPSHSANLGVELVVGALEQLSKYDEGDSSDNLQFGDPNNPEGQGKPPEQNQDETDPGKESAIAANMSSGS